MEDPTAINIAAMEALAQKSNRWMAAMEKATPFIAKGEPLSPELEAACELEMEPDEDERIWELLEEIAPETYKYMSGFVDD